MPVTLAIAAMAPRWLRTVRRDLPELSWHSTKKAMASSHAWGRSFNEASSHEVRAPLLLFLLLLLVGRT